MDRRNFEGLKIDHDDVVLEQIVVAEDRSSHRLGISDMLLRNGTSWLSKTTVAGKVRVKEKEAIHMANDGCLPCQCALLFFVKTTPGHNVKSSLFTSTNSVSPTLGRIPVGVDRGWIAPLSCHCHYHKIPLSRRRPMRPSIKHMRAHALLLGLGLPTPCGFSWVRRREFRRISPVFSPVTRH